MSNEETTELRPEVLMLAYLCIKDVEGLVDQVEILDRFRLNNSQIAAVCGCKVQSVINARSKYRKKK